MGCTGSKIQHQDAVDQCENRKSHVKQAVMARTALAVAHARYVQALNSTAGGFRQFLEGEFRSAQGGAEDHHHPATAAAAAAADGGVAAVAAAAATPPNVHSSSAFSSSGSSSGSSSSGSSEIVHAMPLWTTATQPLTVVLSPPRSPDSYNTTSAGDAGGAASYRGEFFLPRPPPPPPQWWTSPRGGHTVGGDSSPPPPPEAGGSGWEYFDIFHPPMPAVHLQEQRRYKHILVDEEEEEEDIPALESDGEQTKERLNRTNLHKEPEKHDRELEPVPEPEHEERKEDADVNEEKESKEDGADIGEQKEEVPPEETSKVEGEVDASEDVPGPSAAPSSPMELVDVLRELEEQFLRAADISKPVLRMLEARQLEKGISDLSSSSKLLSALSLGHWSPRALSSSRDDFESLLGEGGGMTGSHAATLERLYAWEKKLYEEVKSWESIKMEFDRKRKLLRNQDAKGAKLDAIDKTRASMKALETQISVALQAMEASSAAIQKITDLEMLPQLLELLEGLATMWKGMHECHQHQLTVVEQLKFPDNVILEATSSSHRNTTLQLEAALTAWHTTLSTFVSTQKDYMRSLIGWIRHSLLPPDASHSSRRTFLHNKRVLIPKIQFMCDNWSQALDTLPLAEVTNVIKEFAETLREIGRQQAEEIRIQKRAEVLAKELNKKIISLNNLEKKYLESKEKQQDSASSQLSERKASVEALKRKVRDDKVNVTKAIQETRSLTLKNLQKGLPRLFQALSNFAGICENTYQGVYLRAKDYAPNSERT